MILKLVARAEAPSLLAELLGGREVARTETGKPYVVDGSLHFNLSHSGDYALIAVHRDAPVGVDIEKHRERIQWRAIATRFFAPEEAAALESREDFFRLWVRKEAVLKALGTGLRGQLASTPYERCDIEMVDVPEGYSAAVAVLRSSR